MGKRFNLRVQLPACFHGLFPGAIWKKPSEGKVVYLTFDDGPVPGVTPAVLKILQHYGIKATFFCVGENVCKHPDVFELIKEKGHAVGNHTYNHLHGLKNRTAPYLDNVEKADQVIGSNLFRPPYGLMKGSQYRAIRAKFNVIMWDVISCDYDPKLSPEDCFNNVSDFVRDGSIITFHDSYKSEKNVLNALPMVIERLLSEGYSFKRIEFTKTRLINDDVWNHHMKRHGVAKKHRKRA
ncbi:MAG TPA: polysaccharide deacetylase family protein [Prolixibacteraceae bacterium]|nr:polysaccharide deacetylase family protein [Prolixibacteraceae bacterium]HPS13824.1 polysaccharide deacetylase family protein [Prolixibacteraceae bacterium]